MNKTAIEWCTHTWNPVTGCLHGCPYCYARRIAKRFKSGANLNDDCTQPGNGLHEIRYPSGNAANGWRYGFAPTFHSHRINEPRWRKKPARIFVSSMGDLFGEWVPREWIEAVLKVVRECPRHTFIFLTKNPKRYAEFDFPANAWIGTTVEDQECAGERIPLLLEARAAVRFVSLEPLLGPVGIGFWVDPTGYHCGGEPEFCHCFDGYPRDDDGWLATLDWVIVGAETGPGARSCDHDWVEDIVDQVRGAGVPVFVKDNCRYQERIQEYPGVRKGA